VSATSEFSGATSRFAMGWKCTNFLLFLQLISCFYVSIYLLEPFLTLKLNRNNEESADVAAGSGEMFDKIAKYYDSANTVMSLGNDHAWVLTHLLIGYSLTHTYSLASQAGEQRKVRLSCIY
jgi:hypothetical protein